MPLPPDPDELNDRRSEWAAAAIDAFSNVAYGTEEDPLTKVADLLCDLRHWCDRNDVDFEQAMEYGAGNYAEETAV